MTKSHHESEFELPFYQQFSLDPQVDRPCELGQVVSRLKTGAWGPPVYQRGVVWTDLQTKGWVDRIKESNPAKPSGQIVGCLVTYQIYDESIKERKPIYILDGMQRVSASKKLVEEPEIFGISHEGAQHILSSVMIPVQHRWYLTHDAAFRDFQLLNAGTALTPLEYQKGHLALLPNYEELVPIFGRIHNAITNKDFVGKGKKRRDDIHRGTRSDYALMHYWLSGEKELPIYKGVGVKKPNSVGDRIPIEILLRSECEQRSTGEMTKELEKLETYIDNVAALCKVAWYQEFGVGLAMRPKLFRWFLPFGIWRERNKKSVTQWQDFLSKLFHCSQGKTSIETTSGKEVVSPGRGDKFPNVCQLIESDLHDGSPLRRKKGSLLARGFDNSHLIPFALHGEGATIPEPASVNRARGMEPIFTDHLQGIPV